MGCWVLRLWWEYVEQIAQCGEAAASIFHHFSASIGRALGLDGGIGTRL